ncbi:MAG: hypothetical protein ACYTBS_27490, partial [Planctomycetota bacterium]
IFVMRSDMEFRWFVGQEVPPFLGLCHFFTASLCASLARDSSVASDSSWISSKEQKRKRVTVPAKVVLLLSK